MDRALNDLTAYRLFLKEAKELKLSVADRSALFTKTLSSIKLKDHRLAIGLSALQIYHAQLGSTYTDEVDLACLNETSLSHTFKSVSAVEILQWVKAYKDARPRAKNRAGGRQDRRNPRPHRTSRSTSATRRPAAKPKPATDAVEKPASGK